MSATGMWTSKLGGKYPMSWMQENDRVSQQELKQLRSLSSNSVCADCGRQDNSWASVTHGVFICMICSDVHRSVGTHITKVKGCTGTYLWGPDELERMKSVGNQGALMKYGSRKIEPDASKEQKQRYVVEKYDKLSFASDAQHATQTRLATAKDAKEVQSKGPVVRKVAVVPKCEPAPSPTAKQPFGGSSAQKTTAAPKACATEISDSWFEDFFRDSCTDSLVSTTELSTTPSLKTGPAPLSDASNNLDAFLDMALQTKPAVNCSLVSAYPASLDPFQKVQPATVTDPFADWPEF